MSGAECSASIGRCPFLPHNLRHKILFSEYLIAEFFEIVNFVVVNGNEDHTIIPEEI